MVSKIISFLQILSKKYKQLRYLSFIPLLLLYKILKKFWIFKENYEIIVRFALLEYSPPLLLGK